jgi:hypothetical protein
MCKVNLYNENLNQNLLSTSLRMSFIHTIPSGLDQWCIVWSNENPKGDMEFWQRRQACKQYS